MREPFVAAAAHRDLRHRQVDYGIDPDNLADVLAPTGAGESPLVIVVHGGFWRAIYDRGHTAAQCAALASSGYVVAALEYRRVGKGGGWPTTFHDIAAGVDALPQLLRDVVDRPG
jgi:acetyl esterase/lipase